MKQTRKKHNADVKCFKLKFFLPIIGQQVDQTKQVVDRKLKELSPVSKSTTSSEGRSSSLVRTLALRAKGRRSESGSAHSYCLSLDRHCTRSLQVRHASGISEIFSE